MKQREAPLLVERSAHFSPCRKYRYWLKIVWDASKPLQAFIGLNPSTADEKQDDPTVRRCIDFARRWGKGGLLMLNACAYRATDPKDMLDQDDPIGPDNTIANLECWLVRFKTGPPIAAWGKNLKLVWMQENDPSFPSKLNRADEMRIAMGPMDCLGTNADGTPKHPLYLKADTPPRPFNY
jgi:hypothetical protein